MRNNLKENEQWLSEGNCVLCRKQNYCGSPCSANKKMIAEIVADQKVVEIVDDLDKVVADVGLSVDPLQYYNRHQESLDSEDREICLDGYKKVLADAFDDMILMMNALKAIKVDGIVDDVKAAYVIDAMNNSVNDINNYIVGPNRIPLNIFEQTLSKTIQEFKGSK